MQTTTRRAAPVKTGKKPGKIDRVFLFTLLILIAIGLLMVFSASMYSSTINGEKGYSQFLKQSFFAAVGLVMMYWLSRRSYLRWRSETFVRLAMLASIVLLFLVLIPGVGVKVNDARRWINLGITNFQPSELAKVVGILYMASTVTRHPEYLKGPFGNNAHTKNLWKYCYLPIGILAGLTVIEPSMSAAMVIALGMVAVLWFAGISMSQFLPFLGLGALGVAFFIFKESWRLDRIFAAFGASSTNYQIRQSLLAFGSGRLFGVGLGYGKQKLLFLPEIQNDFIFANIGEEFGLVGCLVVLALYVILIVRGFQIAFACKNKFGFLYTASVMTVLAFQVFVNIGVATSTIPVTGMALPFISYGGTSIIILLMMIGPILNISRRVSLKPFILKGNEQEKEQTSKNTHRSRRNGRAYLSGNRDRG